MPSVFLSAVLTYLTYGRSARLRDNIQAGTNTMKTRVVYSVTQVFCPDVNYDVHDRMVYERSLVPTYELDPNDWDCLVAVADAQVIRSGVTRAFIEEAAPNEPPRIVYDINAFYLRGRKV